MGGELIACRSPARRPAGGAASRGRSRAAAAAGPAEAILRLQRQVGNEAVRRLLEKNARASGVPRAGSVQRDVGSHRENPPVTVLNPAGTLSDERWTAAYQAAVAKPSVEAYQPLFRDIAVTSGMAALGPSFVPSTVPVSDGTTAKPGLNMTLNTSDEPGHTGWVDKNGGFGVPAVQKEALTRLREYHATLGIEHRRLWKEWLDKQLAGAANDKTGRKDFLARLAGFVT